MRITAKSFLMRASISYVLGISFAAAIASLSGGSTWLLIHYSRVAGSPFFIAATLFGLTFRRSVVEHALLWAAMVPIVTGVIWFGLSMSVGELFDAKRVGLYAMFCAGISAAAFLVTLSRWPPRQHNAES